MHLVPLSRHAEKLRVKRSYCQGMGHPSTSCLPTTLAHPCSGERDIDLHNATCWLAVRTQVLTATTQQNKPKQTNLNHTKLYDQHDLA